MKITSKEYLRTVKRTARTGARRSDTSTNSNDNKRLVQAIQNNLCSLGCLIENQNGRRLYGLRLFLHAQSVLI